MMDTNFPTEGKREKKIIHGLEKGMKSAEIKVLIHVGDNHDIRSD